MSGDTNTTVHHVDCDGYRFAHFADAVQVHPLMVRAQCRHCDWLGPTYSADTGKPAARRDANQHGEEVRCDGRCLDWGAEAITDITTAENRS